MFYGSIAITIAGKDSLESVCFREIFMSCMLIYRFSSIKRQKVWGLFFGVGMVGWFGFALFCLIF